jgi:hypothetical protein
MPASSRLPANRVVLKLKDSLGVKEKPGSFEK